MRKRNLLYFLLLILVWTSTSACTLGQNKRIALAMQLSYDQADHRGAAHLTRKALKKNRDKPDVGLLMDLCAYLHYAGEYEKSNLACQAAEARADTLYTKSIREQAAAFLTNDNAISFQGEDYERLFLHVIGMLNYAALNKPESALVEARKLDNKTRYFKQNPEKVASHYQEEPLGRFIAGLLYEENRDNNDALIDFKKSIRAFESNHNMQTPSSLPQDATRVAYLHGMPEEQAKLERSFGLLNKSFPLTKQTGEVIVVFENGYNAYKIERNGLPYQPQKSSTVNIARVKALQTGTVAQSNAFRDVVFQTRHRLRERMPSIEQRLVKQRAAKAAVSVGVGLLAWFAGGAQAGLQAGTATAAILSILSAADIRSWSTLPAQFQIARLTLPPGKHDLAVKLYGHYGTELYRGLLKDVAIRPGKRTWIIQKLP